MRILVLSPLLFSAVACAGLDATPSLAPRAVERLVDLSAPLPPGPAAPPVPADAELASAIAAQLAKADRGEAAFANALRENTAEIVAGRASPEGSDRWIAGQTAVSALEAARADSLEAQVALDTLMIAQTEMGGGGIEALAQAQAQVAAIVAKQAAQLAELSR